MARTLSSGNPDMYAVGPSVWVRVATMHFKGPVARWLQSFNYRMRMTHWAELCTLIHDRFGWDQHDSLIRQLFHIKQTRPVQEYIDLFSELVDQLIAYGHSAPDHHYFTTRFIDGLRNDIKSVVLIQRPVDLNTASTLVLLQEEADTSKRRKFKKLDYVYKPKPSTMPTPKPLPPPPLELDNPQGLSQPTDKKFSDVATTSSDRKVAVLRAYHHAWGLCQYCTEKWSRRHKCGTTIQLYAV
jgi:hypothetical protein